MRKSFIVMLVALCISVGTSVLNAQKIQHITAEEFQKEIFDYKNKVEWEFNGETPILVDFYASWCGPCRKLAPILKELQKEYGDKIKIYKVNTDKERELSGVFGVQRLPTLIFIPKKGQPTKAEGLMDKKTLKQAFNELFGI